MRKIVALILTICMLVPNVVMAQENVSERAKVYLFGDEWASQWGQSLSDFFYDSSDFINMASDGELLSTLSKKAEFGEIKKSDIVILSYGVLEKDRAGDKNADFSKALENVTAALQKKGAEVMFVSVCSTMRFNTLTGKMDETKNYYTETTRTFAKKNNLTYIDLANLTAAWATRLGSAGANKIYKSNLSLTDHAKTMCAYEVFKKLCNYEGLHGMMKISLSQVSDVAVGETSKVFDVFFEDELTQTYTVYVKNGSGVMVNNLYAGDGDITFSTQSVNGKINVSFSSCEKIQVTPVYKFEAAGFATTDAPFTGNIYPGLYNVTVKKTEPLKASVYLNGFLIASNLDMPGTQPVPEAAEHTFTKYHVEKGGFEVTVKGLTDKLEYIYFCESEKIFDKKPKIFVGGDSTVCNYYPLLRTGQEEDGTVMTGWAMLLDRYVDAEVINLAASGDWAANWLVNSFPIVEKEGQPGDIFIVQFGINDHDKSTVQEMTSALGEMIDRAAAKGIVPILVSPQISAGYGWGNESNVGKSDGGAYVEFFDAVRSLAGEKGCFYVDLTDLSSGWFSEVGRDNVYKKYHLWDYENDKPKDMMHLSYKGADAMCRFFVMAIRNISAANTTDKWGNSLNILKIW